MSSAAHPMPVDEPSREPLGPPSAGIDLTGFPRCSLLAGTMLYRAHSSGWGCWNFVHVEGTGGRFDTPAPGRGVCYTAKNARTALAEYLGFKVLASPLPMPPAFDRLTVSVLTVPRRLKLINLTSNRCARFAASGRELSAMWPYTTAQAWAARWAQLDVDGICYLPRHDVRQQARSVALFEQQTDSWSGPQPMLLEPEVRSLATAYGITLEEPTRATLRVISPPR